MSVTFDFKELERFIAQLEGIGNNLQSFVKSTSGAATPKADFKSMISPLVAEIQKGMKLYAKELGSGKNIKGIESLLKDFAAKLSKEQGFTRKEITSFTTKLFPVMKGLSQVHSGKGVLPASTDPAQKSVVGAQNLKKTFAEVISVFKNMKEQLDASSKSYQQQVIKMGDSVGQADFNQRKATKFIKDIADQVHTYRETVKLLGGAIKDEVIFRKLLAKAKPGDVTDATAHVEKSIMKFGGLTTQLQFQLSSMIKSMSEVEKVTQGRIKSVPGFSGAQKELTSKFAGVGGKLFGLGNVAVSANKMMGPAKELTDMMEKYLAKANEVFKGTADEIAIEADAMEQQAKQTKKVKTTADKSRVAREKLKKAADKQRQSEVGAKEAGTYIEKQAQAANLIATEAGSHMDAISKSLIRNAGQLEAGLKLFAKDKLPGERAKGKIKLTDKLRSKLKGIFELADKLDVVKSIEGGPLLENIDSQISSAKIQMEKMKGELDKLGGYETSVDIKKAKALGFTGIKGLIEAKSKLRKVIAEKAGVIRGLKKDKMVLGLEQQIAGTKRNLDHVRSEINKLEDYTKEVDVLKTEPIGLKDLAKKMDVLQKWKRRMYEQTKKRIFTKEELKSFNNLSGQIASITSQLNTLKVTDTALIAMGVTSESPERQKLTIEIKELSEKSSKKSKAYRDLNDRLSKEVKGSKNYRTTVARLNRVQADYDIVTENILKARAVLEREYIVSRTMEAGGTGSSEDVVKYVDSAVEALQKQEKSKSEFLSKLYESKRETQRSLRAALRGTNILDAAGFSKFDRFVKASKTKQVSKLEGSEGVTFKFEGTLTKNLELLQKQLGELAARGIEDVGIAVGEQVENNVTKTVVRLQKGISGKKIAKGEAGLVPVGGGKLGGDVQQQLADVEKQVISQIQKEVGTVGQRVSGRNIQSEAMGMAQNVIRATMGYFMSKSPQSSRDIAQSTDPNFMDPNRLRSHLMQQGSTAPQAEKLQQEFFKLLNSELSSLSEFDTRSAEILKMKGAEGTVGDEMMKALIARKSQQAKEMLDQADIGKEFLGPIQNAIVTFKKGDSDALIDITNKIRIRALKHISDVFIEAYKQAEKGGKGFNLSGAMSNVEKRLMKDLPSIIGKETGKGAKAVDVSEAAVPKGVFEMLQNTMVEEDTRRMGEQNRRLITVLNDLFRFSMRKQKTGPQMGEQRVPFRPEYIPKKMKYKGKTVVGMPGAVSAIKKAKETGDEAMLEKMENRLVELDAQQLKEFELYREYFERIYRYADQGKGKEAGTFTEKGEELVNRIMLGKKENIAKYEKFLSSKRKDKVMPKDLVDRLKRYTKGGTQTARFTFALRRLQELTIDEVAKDKRMVELVGDMSQSTNERRQDLLMMLENVMERYEADPLSKLTTTKGVPKVQKGQQQQLKETKNKLIDVMKMQKGKGFSLKNLIEMSQEAGQSTAVGIKVMSDIIDTMKGTAELGPDEIFKRADIAGQMEQMPLVKTVQDVPKLIESEKKLKASIKALEGKKGKKDTEALSKLNKKLKTVQEKRAEFSKNVLIPLVTQFMMGGTPEQMISRIGAVVAGGEATGPGSASAKLAGEFLGTGITKGQDPATFAINARKQFSDKLRKGLAVFQKMGMDLPEKLIQMVLDQFLEGSSYGKLFGSVIGAIQKSAKEDIANLRFPGQRGLQSEGIGGIGKPGSKLDFSRQDIHKAAEYTQEYGKVPLGALGGGISQEQSKKLADIIVTVTDTFNLTNAQFKELNAAISILREEATKVRPSTAAQFAKGGAAGGMDWSKFGAFSGLVEERSSISTQKWPTASAGSAIHSLLAQSKRQEKAEYGKPIVEQKLPGTDQLMGGTPDVMEYFEKGKTQITDIKSSTKKYKDWIDVNKESFLTQVAMYKELFANANTGNAELNATIKQMVADLQRVKLVHIDTNAFIEAIGPELLKSMGLEELSKIPDVVDKAIQEEFNKAQADLKTKKKKMPTKENRPELLLDPEFAKSVDRNINTVIENIDQQSKVLKEIDPDNFDKLQKVIQGMKDSGVITEKTFDLKELPSMDKIINSTMRAVTTVSEMSAQMKEFEAYAKKSGIKLRTIQTVSGEKASSKVMFEYYEEFKKYLDKKGMDIDNFGNFEKLAAQEANRIIKKQKSIVRGMPKDKAKAVVQEAQRVAAGPAPGPGAPQVVVPSFDISKMTAEEAKSFQLIETSLGNIVQLISTKNILLESEKRLIEEEVHAFAAVGAVLKDMGKFLSGNATISKTLKNVSQAMQGMGVPAKQVEKTVQELEKQLAAEKDILTVKDKIVNSYTEAAVKAAQEASTRQQTAQTGGVSGAPAMTMTGTTEGTDETIDRYKQLKELVRDQGAELKKVSGISKDTNVPLAERLTMLDQAVMTLKEYKKNVKALNAEEKKEKKGTVSGRRGRDIDASKLEGQVQQTFGKLTQESFQAADPTSALASHIEQQALDLRGQAESAGKAMLELKRKYGREFEKEISMTKKVTDLQGNQIAIVDAIVSKQGEVTMAIHRQVSVYTGPLADQMKNILVRLAKWGSGAFLYFGIMRGARSAINTIKEVEEAVIKLRQVMDNATSNFNMMQSSAFEVSKSYAQPIAEVFKSMQEFARQGLAQQQVIELTRVSTLAANVTVMNATKAMDVLTAATRQYSMDVMDSINVLDAWNEVANNNAVTAKDLGEAMKQSGSIASLIGLSFEDLTGMMATLQETTRRGGPTVGRAMRFMLTHLRTDETENALNRLGITIRKTAGEYRTASTIFEEIAERWREMGSAQKYQIAQAIGQVRFGAFVAAMFENWDKVTKASTEALYSQGSALAENEIAMEALNRQVVALQNTWKEFIATMGQTGILDIFKGIVNVGGDIIGVFNKLPDSVKKVVTLATTAGLAFMGLSRMLSWYFGVNLANALQNLGNKKMVQGIIGNVSATGAAAQRSGMIVKRSAAEIRAEYNRVKATIKSTTTVMAAHGKKASNILKMEQVQVKKLRREYRALLSQKRGAAKAVGGGPSMMKTGVAIGGIGAGLWAAGELASAATGKEKFSEVGSKAGGVAMNLMMFTMAGQAAKKMFTKSLFKGMGSSLKVGFMSLAGTLKGFVVSHPYIAIGAAAATAIYTGMRVLKDKYQVTADEVIEQNKAITDSLQQTISKARSATEAYSNLVAKMGESNYDPQLLQQEARLREELAAHFPELAASYSDYGDAILDASMNIDEFRMKMKKLADDKSAELVRYKLEEIREVMDDLRSETDHLEGTFAYWFDTLEGGESTLDTVRRMTKLLRLEEEKLVKLRRAGVTGPELDKQKKAVRTLEIELKEPKARMDKGFAKVEKRIRDLKKLGTAPAVAGLAEEFETRPEGVGALLDRDIQTHGAQDALKGLRVFFTRVFPKEISDIVNSPEAIPYKVLESGSKRLLEAVAKAVSLKELDLTEGQVGSVRDLVKQLDKAMDMHDFDKELSNMFSTIAGGTDVGNILANTISKQIGDSVMMVTKTVDGEKLRKYIVQLNDQVYTMNESDWKRIFGGKSHTEVPREYIEKNLMHVAKKFTKGSAFDALQKAFAEGFAPNTTKLIGLGKSLESAYVDAFKIAQQAVKVYTENMKLLNKEVEYSIQLEKNRLSALREIGGMGKKDAQFYRDEMDRLNSTLNEMGSKYLPAINASAAFKKELVDVVALRAHSDVVIENYRQLSSLKDRYLSDPGTFIKDLYSVQSIINLSRGTGIDWMQIMNLNDAKNTSYRIAQSMRDIKESIRGVVTSGLDAGDFDTKEFENGLRAVKERIQEAGGVFNIDDIKAEVERLDISPDLKLFDTDVAKQQLMDIVKSSEVAAERVQMPWKKIEFAEGLLGGALFEAMIKDTFSFLPDAISDVLSDIHPVRAVRSAMQGIDQVVGTSLAGPNFVVRGAKAPTGLDPKELSAYTVELTRMEKKWLEIASWLEQRDLDSWVGRSFSNWDKWEKYASARAEGVRGKIDEVAQVRKVAILFDKSKTLASAKEMSGITAKVIQEELQKELLKLGGFKFARSLDTELSDMESRILSSNLGTLLIDMMKVDEIAKSMIQSGQRIAETAGGDMVLSMLGLTRKNLGKLIQTAQMQTAIASVTSEIWASFDSKLKEAAKAGDTKRVDEMTKAINKVFKGAGKAGRGINLKGLVDKGFLDKSAFSGYFEVMSQLRFNSKNINVAMAAMDNMLKGTLAAFQEGSAESVMTNVQKTQNKRAKELTQLLNSALQMTQELEKKRDEWLKSLKEYATSLKGWASTATSGFSTTFAVFGREFKGMAGDLAKNIAIALSSADPKMREYGDQLRKNLGNILISAISGVNVPAINAATDKIRKAVAVDLFEGTDVSGAREATKQIRDLGIKWAETLSKFQPAEGAVKGLESYGDVVSTAFVNVNRLLKKELRKNLKGIQEAKKEVQAELKKDVATPGEVATGDIDYMSTITISKANMQKVSLKYTQEEKDASKKYEEKRKAVADFTGKEGIVLPGISFDAETSPEVLSSVIEATIEAIKLDKISVERKDELIEKLKELGEAQKLVYKLIGDRSVKYEKAIKETTNAVNSLFESFGNGARVTETQVEALGISTWRWALSLSKVNEAATDVSHAFDSFNMRMDITEGFGLMPKKMDLSKVKSVLQKQTETLVDDIMIWTRTKAETYGGKDILALEKNIQDSAEFAIKDDALSKDDRYMLAVQRNAQKGISLLGRQVSGAVLSEEDKAGLENIKKTFSKELSKAFDKEGNLDPNKAIDILQQIDRQIEVGEKEVKAKAKKLAQDLQTVLRMEPVTNAIYEGGENLRKAMAQHAIFGGAGVMKTAAESYRKFVSELANATEGADVNTSLGQILEGKSGKGKTKFEGILKKAWGQYNNFMSKMGRETIEIDAFKKLTLSAAGLVDTIMQVESSQEALSYSLKSSADLYKVYETAGVGGDFSVAAKFGQELNTQITNLSTEYAKLMSLTRDGVITEEEKERAEIVRNRLNSMLKLQKDIMNIQKQSELFKGLETGVSKAKAAEFFGADVTAMDAMGDQFKSIGMFLAETESDLGRFGLSYMSLVTDGIIKPSKEMDVEFDKMASHINKAFDKTGMPIKVTADKLKGLTAETYKYVSALASMTGMNQQTIKSLEAFWGTAALYDKIGLSKRFEDLSSILSVVDGKIESLRLKYAEFITTGSIKSGTGEQIEEQIELYERFRERLTGAQGVVSANQDLVKSLNLLGAQAAVYNSSLDSVGKTADYFKSTIDKVIETSTQSGEKTWDQVGANIRFAVMELEDYYSELLGLQRQQDFIHKQIDSIGDAWNQALEPDSDKTFLQGFTESFKTLRSNMRREFMQPVLDDWKNLFTTEVPVADIKDEAEFAIRSALAEAKKDSAGYIDKMRGIKAELADEMERLLGGVSRRFESAAQNLADTDFGDVDFDDTVKKPVTELTGSNAKLITAVDKLEKTIVDKFMRDPIVEKGLKAVKKSTGKEVTPELLLDWVKSHEKGDVKPESWEEYTKGLQKQIVEFIKPGLYNIIKDIQSAIREASKSAIGKKAASGLRMAGGINGSIGSLLGSTGGGAGEYPAILHAGEIVVPAHLAGGVPYNIVNKLPTYSSFASGAAILHKDETFTKKQTTIPVNIIDALSVESATKILEYIERRSVRDAERKAAKKSVSAERFAGGGVLAKAMESVRASSNRESTVFRQEFIIGGKHNVTLPTKLFNLLSNDSVDDLVFFEKARTKIRLRRRAKVSGYSLSEADHIGHVLSRAFDEKGKFSPAEHRSFWSNVGSKLTHSTSGEERGVKVVEWLNTLDRKSTKLQAEINKILQIHKGKYEGFASGVRMAGGIDGSVGSLLGSTGGGAGEYPAILHAGEIVVPAHLAGGVPYNIVNKLPTYAASGLRMAGGADVSSEFKEMMSKFIAKSGVHFRESSTKLHITFGSQSPLAQTSFSSDKTHKSLLQVDKWIRSGIRETIKTNDDPKRAALYNFHERLIPYLVALKSREREGSFKLKQKTEMAPALAFNEKMSGGARLAKGAVFEELMLMPPHKLAGRGRYTREELDTASDARFEMMIKIVKGVGKVGVAGVKGMITLLGKLNKNEVTIPHVNNELTSDQKELIAAIRGGFGGKSKKPSTSSDSHFWADVLRGLKIIGGFLGGGLKGFGKAFIDSFGRNKRLYQASQTKPGQRSALDIAASHAQGARYAMGARIVSRPVRAVTGLSMSAKVEDFGSINFKAITKEMQEEFGLLGAVIAQERKQRDEMIKALSSNKKALEDETTASEADFHRLSKAMGEYEKLQKQLSNIEKKKEEESSKFTKQTVTVSGTASDIGGQSNTKRMSKLSQKEKELEGSIDSVVSSLKDLGDTFDGVDGTISSMQELNKKYKTAELESWMGGLVQAGKVVDDFAGTVGKGLLAGMSGSKEVLAMFRNEIGLAGKKTKEYKESLRVAAKAEEITQGSAQEELIGLKGQDEFKSLKMDDEAILSKATSVAKGDKKIGDLGSTLRKDSPEFRAISILSKHIKSLGKSSTDAAKASLKKKDATDAEAAAALSAAKSADMFGKTLATLAETALVGLGQTAMKDITAMTEGAFGQGKTKGTRIKEAGLEDFYMETAQDKPEVQSARDEGAAVGEAVGSGVGEAAGMAIGGPVGAAIGKMAGGLIGKIAGSAIGEALAPKETETEKKERELESAIKSAEQFGNILSNVSSVMSIAADMVSVSFEGMIGSVTGAISNFGKGLNDGKLLINTYGNEFITASGAINDAALSSAVAFSDSSNITTDAAKDFYNEMAGLSAEDFMTAAGEGGELGTADYSIFEALSDATDVLAASFDALDAAAKSYEAKLNRFSDAITKADGSIMQLGEDLMLTAFQATAVVEVFKDMGAGGGKGLNFEAVLAPFKAEIGMKAAETATLGAQIKQSTAMRDLQLQSAGTAEDRDVRSDEQFLFWKWKGDEDEVKVAQRDKDILQAQTAAANSAKEIANLNKQIAEIEAEIAAKMQEAVAALDQYANQINNMMTKGQGMREAWELVGSMFSDMGTSEMKEAFSSVSAIMGEGMTGLMSGVEDAANGLTLLGEADADRARTILTSQDTDIGAGGITGRDAYEDMITGASDAYFAKSADKLFSSVGDMLALSAEQITAIAGTSQEVADLVASMGVREIYQEYRKFQAQEATKRADLAMSESDMIANIMVTGMDNLVYTANDHLAAMETTLSDWASANDLVKEGITEAVDKFATMGESIAKQAYLTAVGSAASPEAAFDAYANAVKDTLQLYTETASGQLDIHPDAKKFYGDQLQLAQQQVDAMLANRSADVAYRKNLLTGNAALKTALGTTFDFEKQTAYTADELQLIQEKIGELGLPMEDQLGLQAQVLRFNQEIAQSSSEISSKESELVGLGHEANEIMNRQIDAYKKEFEKPGVEREFIQRNLEALRNMQHSINRSTGGVFTTETGDINRVSEAEWMALNNIGEGQFEVAKTLEEFEKLYGEKIDRGPKDVSTYSTVRPITNNINIQIDNDFIDPSQLDADKQRSLALMVKDALIEEGFRYATTS